MLNLFLSPCLTPCSPCMHPLWLSNGEKMLKTQYLTEYYIVVTVACHLLVPPANLECWAPVCPAQVATAYTLTAVALVANKRNNRQDKTDCSMQAAAVCWCIVLYGSTATPCVFCWILMYSSPTCWWNDEWKMSVLCDSKHKVSPVLLLVTTADSYHHYTYTGHVERGWVCGNGLDVVRF